MKTMVPTYWAQIFVGMRGGYGSRIHAIEEIEAICQEEVDRVGLCVTVTPTRYIYKFDSEPGAIIGLINYPRFPKKDYEMRQQALSLASLLRHRLRQIRISVMLPDQTIIFTTEDAESTDGAR